MRRFWYGLLGALLAVLGVLLIRHSRLSDLPPSGPCAPGDYWVDCIAGSKVKCPHESHLYACLDGKWKLVEVSDGARPDIVVPMIPLPMAKEK